MTKTRIPLNIIIIIFTNVIDYEIVYLKVEAQSR